MEEVKDLLADQGEALDQAVVIIEFLEADQLVLASIVSRGVDGNGRVLSSVEDQGGSRDGRGGRVVLEVLDEVPVDGVKLFVGAGQGEKTVALPALEASRSDEVDEDAVKMKAGAEEDEAIDFLRVTGRPEGEDVAPHAGGADAPGAAGMACIEVVEDFQGS